MTAELVRANGLHDGPEPAAGFSTAAAIGAGVVTGEKPACNRSWRAGLGLTAASVPITKKLNLVAYALGGEGTAQAQDSAQLFTNGESLLMNQDYSAMFTTGF